MSPVFQSNARCWLVGLVLAASGVAVARWIAPLFENNPDRVRALIALTGEVIALAGLLVIALGIRRRANNAARQAVE